MALIGIYNPSASFTRPANTTAYSTGNLIGNSTTAGSVTTLTWKLQTSNIIGPFTLKRVYVQKSTTAVTNFKVNVHFYTQNQTVTNGDGGAFSSTGSANYVGYIQVDGTTLPGAKFSDGAVGLGANPAGAEYNVRLPSGNTLFGLLEAAATYTPGSAEVFTVTVELLEPQGD